MKIGNHIRLAGFLMGLSALTLPAKDAVAYHVGDVAGKDIVATCTLDVVDPTATAALQASEGARTPAVFRSFSGVTNGIAAHFSAAFEGAHSKFVNSLRETYHQTTLDEATVTSPDFGYLVTAFNIKNRDLPISSSLAAEWAYGKSGSFEENRLLSSLLAAMQFHIRSDELPQGYGPAETWEIIPVTGMDDKLTLSDAEVRGQAISKLDVLPLSQACLRFRRAFTGFDEQPLARALSAWLKPNCFPDTDLTKLLRDQAVGQLVVAQHYTTGQVIVSQGSVINAKAKAALDQMEEKMAANVSEPPTANISAATADAVPSAPLITAPSAPPTLENPAPASVQSSAIVTAQPEKAPVQLVKPVRHHSWPVIALTVVSIVSALVFISAGIWRLISRRRGVQHVGLVKDLSINSQMALSTALAPQLVDAVRAALVQELAGQRRELLYVQQTAAMEVVRLVCKMDEMQIALNQRLLVYEQQIQRLEADLAARTEENHELIKMKIEMIRQQRQTESVSESVGEHVAFN